MRRDISRQEYLKKREEAKLEELKEALEDEKYLFQARGHTLWNDSFNHIVFLFLWEGALHITGSIV